MEGPPPPCPTSPHTPRQRIPGGMHACGKRTELPTEWGGQAWRLTPEPYGVVVVCGATVPDQRGLSPRHLPVYTRMYEHGSPAVIAVSGLGTKPGLVGDHGYDHRTFSGATTSPLALILSPSRAAAAAAAAAAARCRLR